MTITKSDLIEAISDRLDLSSTEAKAVFETLLETMKSTLASGEDLMISGFGRLEVKATEQDLWQVLKKENHFALIRHALGPGSIDPQDFNIKDCATQRNLSEKGRNQARNIGRHFRAKGIYNAEVYSSQWCR